MATNTSIKPVSRSNTTGLRDGSSGKTPQSPTATSTILPGPNPGERLATYFDKFFATIIAISTLGASITFTKMVSSPVTPWIDYGYNIITIQTWLAISWLLWVIALVLAALFASLLSLYRPQAIEAFSTKNHHNKRRTMWAATWVSMLLFSLVVASFLVLSLVVAAYTGPVGWAALGITATFGLVGMIGIIWQSPLEWPNWLLKLLPRSGKDEPNANRKHYSPQNTFGLDTKGHGSSWPLYGTKTAPRPSILPETNENKPQTVGPGANLTGGALFSSMRRNPLYTDISGNKEFGVDTMDSSRLEDSQTTEKEWAAYRSAGGQPMRLHPRVSWPRDNVVSDQYSPVPAPAQLYLPPQQPEEPHPQPPPPIRRQPRREFKHDRRERMQMQQAQQQQQQQHEHEHETDPAADAIDQRFSAYPTTNRRSLPPRYEEQEEIGYNREDDLAHQNQPDEQQELHHIGQESDIEGMYNGSTVSHRVGQDSDIEGMYNDSTVSHPTYQEDDDALSELSSLTQDHHHPYAQQHTLHHQSQQVHRTVPASRRAIGGAAARRPAWDVEYGEQ